MLKIHFMQQWFGLSDPAMEEALSCPAPELAAFESAIRAGLAKKGELV